MRPSPESRRLAVALMLLCCASVGCGAAPVAVDGYWQGPSPALKRDLNLAVAWQGSQLVWDMDGFEFGYVFLELDGPCNAAFSQGDGRLEYSGNPADVHGPGILASVGGKLTGNHVELSWRMGASFDKTALQQYQALYPSADPNVTFDTTVTLSGVLDGDVLDLGGTIHYVDANGGADIATVQVPTTKLQRQGTCTFIGG